MPLHRLRFLSVRTGTLTLVMDTESDLKHKPQIPNPLSRAMKLLPAGKMNTDFELKIVAERRGKNRQTLPTPSPVPTIRLGPNEKNNTGKAVTNRNISLACRTGKPLKIKVLILVTLSKGHPADRH